MNDCRRVLARLSAYVDGHLTGDERATVAGHLDRCPPCRELAHREQASHTILRRRAVQLLAEPVPAGLRERCQVLARGSAIVSSWWRPHPIAALVAGLLMVFTASALFSIATQRSDGVLAAQLTADHAKCFRFFASRTGTPVDAAALERMLSADYGWTVHVPPSSAANDVELIGARRCLYGEGLIPHLMYRVHGEDVSLFVLDRTSRRAADLVTLGHRSQIWSKNGTTFVLVSPVETPEMARAARYVMEETR